MESLSLRKRLGGIVVAAAGVAFGLAWFASSKVAVAVTKVRSEELSGVHVSWYCALGMYSYGLGQV